MFLPLRFVFSVLLGTTFIIYAMVWALPGDPFAGKSPWYVLLEISSGEDGGRAAAQLEGLLVKASEDGLISDAVVASSIQQSRDLWKLRESLSEAQKPAGGSIKHDISVPVARIPEFLDRAGAVVEGVCPGQQQSLAEC